MLRKYDDMLTRRFSTQYRNVTDARTDRIAIEISRVRNLRQARSQPSDNGGGLFSSDVGPFSRFENWEFLVAV